MQLFREFQVCIYYFAYIEHVLGSYPLREIYLFLTTKNTLRQVSDQIMSCLRYSQWLDESMCYWYQTATISLFHICY